MKIRVKGNSIRVRLQQNELTELISNHKLVESTIINTFEIFSCELISAESFSVEFIANILTIQIPSGTLESWASGDEVSLEELWNNGTEKGLKILIEKDFACLSNRPDEDDSDAFPNPNKSC